MPRSMIAIFMSNLNMQAKRGCMEVAMNMTSHQYHSGVWQASESGEW